MISLGLDAKVAIDHFVASNFHDGDFDLATKMGK